MSHLSLKETLAWLSTVKPATFYDSTAENGPKYPWLTTIFRFEGCTLKFHDRWLIPGNPRSWILNTVSLLDVDENRLIPEHQQGGVGLRLVTNGYLFRRELEDKSAVWSDYTVAPKEINSYYISFGDKETSRRVSKALVHAITLCKA